jgi:hypothetical protein
VAETGRSLLLANAMDCEFAVTIPNTEDIDESVVAVPLKYGSRVSGVVVISKLGVAQFDEDDVRLLEVLAGHASVALENARLYEAERKERSAPRSRSGSPTRSSTSVASSRPSRAWTTCSTASSSSPRHSLDSPRVSVWLEDFAGGDLTPRAFWGYADEFALAPRS